MIKVSDIIIVEGKYDKNKLKQFIDGTIIETNGFRIFKDKKKQKMIVNLAKNNDIIVLTDSDSAGFIIRNFLRQILNNKEIKHAYIPQILGKEKRKTQHSKEGYLGVEGTEQKIILKALENVTSSKFLKSASISKIQFYNDGFTGKEFSLKNRQKLINALGLPSYITTNALLEFINCTLSFDEYKLLVQKINGDITT